MIKVRQGKSKKRKIKKNRVFTCKIGDIVLWKGKKMWVNEIIISGQEEKINKKGDIVAGIRDSITACNIMENGQIVKRAPRYVDDKWEHYRPG